MIVTCPTCSARYRIDKSKIKGRGAKITCPRCANKFVVYKEKEQTAITNKDFRKVGVTWRLKRGLDEVEIFHTLAQLQQFLENDEADMNDTISYDNRTWIPLHSVENLAGFFNEIWKRAEHGELKPALSIAEPPLPDEDEDDSPTKVIRNVGDLLKDFESESESSSRTPTPSPVYRTRGANTKPAYLDADFGEPEPTVEEVVQVHDPNHIAPEPVLPSGPPTPSPIREEEPTNNLEQKLIIILSVLVSSTLIFAALVYFDIEIPFLTERTIEQPQNRPTITTPTEIPTVPDREKDVPTEAVAPESTSTPKTEANIDEEAPDQEANSEDAEPPPTGEVEDNPGETP